MAKRAPSTGDASHFRCRGPSLAPVRSGRLADLPQVQPGHKPQASFYLTTGSGSLLGALTALEKHHSRFSASKSDIAFGRARQRRQSLASAPDGSHFLLSRGAADAALPAPTLTPGAARIGTTSPGQASIATSAWRQATRTASTGPALALASAVRVMPGPRAERRQAGTLIGIGMDGREPPCTEGSLSERDIGKRPASLAAEAPAYRRHCSDLTRLERSPAPRRIVSSDGRQPASFASNSQPAFWIEVSVERWFLSPEGWV